ncbi:N5-glutamine methyltransferase family protein [Oribacterium sp. Sow4_G1_1]|uniref:N5-glutamine methyltransferase family protein n=1 Tax=Oribacterium sp. Sow4_G1_1 TaxID=3438794 RepID=UPI003F99AE49
MPITTLRQLLDEATETLNTAQVPDPRYDARALLMSAYQLSPAQYLLYEHDAPEALIPRVLPDAEALSAATTLFQANVDRRSRREPLQQILGTAGFYGLDFLVTKDVLCPRADTETLVDAVLGNLMPEQIGAVHAAPSVDPTSVVRTEVENPAVDPSSSEHMVDKCPDFLIHVDNDGASLLDVCTGSGCIAIALTKFGAFRDTMAVDISDAALAIARQNAERLLITEADTTATTTSSAVSADEITVATSTRMNPGPRMEVHLQNAAVDFTLLRSDMFSALAERTEDGALKRYDVIVSNPPYIPSAVVEKLEPEVRDYEPRIALDGTADGLRFYRILAEESVRYLKPGGRIYLEIGYDQGERVPALLAAAGFRDITVIRDFGGNDRVVAAHL